MKLFSMIRRHDIPLFGADAGLFQAAARAATVYGEYGCGNSTVWVAKNVGIPILAVETSRKWADWTQEKSGESAHLLDIDLIDLGPMMDYGRPRTYDYRDRFRDYIYSPWKRDRKPDLVLIDGRFRVATFLASLLNASAGTQIIFDDYVERQIYHVVAEFLAPVEVGKRQARFVVPPVTDRVLIERAAEKFEYVMD